MSFEISLPVKIDANQIAGSVCTRRDRDEVLDFILAIDLAIADVGFTEQLIKRLCASIKGDLGEEEYNALIDELKQPPPRRPGATVL
jgi:hypothetical protein